MNIKTAQILIEEGYTNVFVVDAPDSVDNFILISRSGGFGEGLGSVRTANPTIQVMVADKDYATCNSTAESIKKYLTALTDEQIKLILYRISQFGDYTEFSQMGVFEEYLTDSGEVISRADAYEIVGFELQSDILELGRDEQLRYRMSVNFMIYQNM